ncbi:MAG: VCBS repeat-containing protein [Thermoplasmata archaeon]|nr:MAG: VCBS repeat-containing protein [Thermoplasmata archaeon]
MFTVRLSRFFIILIVLSLCSSGSVIFNTESTAEVQGAPDEDTSVRSASTSSRAAPETYAAFSNMNGEIYYVKFTGTSFSTPSLIGTKGSWIYGIAIADFDNDGDYDIVYGSNIKGKVGYYFLEKTGPGNSFAAELYITSVAYSTDTAQQIAAGDVNNDGKMDFIVSRYHWQNDALVLFLNTGSNTFTTHTFYQGGVYITSKTLVDFDLDGNLDLVVELNSDNNLYWFKGNGKGNFSKPMLVGYTFNSNLYGIAAGDFDGNNKMEVLFAPSWRNVWYSYEYIGKFEFDNINYNYVAPSNAPFTSYSLAPYDFNGDGYPDIFYADLWFPDRGIYWMKNDQKGKLKDPIKIISTTDSAYGVATPTDLPKDFDNDNFPDYWEDHVGLSKTNPYEDDWDLDGDGLTNRQEFENGSNPSIVDTDGDGLSDYDEVIKYGTDPWNPDSDFDMLSDYDEVIKYQSKPDVMNSDGSGLVDGMEALLDSDPVKGYDDYLRIDNATRNDTDKFDQPDVVTDSKNNTHIAFVGQPVGVYYEIFYMMVDKFGKVLIDTSQITASDSRNSLRPQIAVDSEDKIHITWMDFRNLSSSRAEIYHIKLDPYKLHVEFSGIVIKTFNGSSALLSWFVEIKEHTVTINIHTSDAIYNVHRMTMDSRDYINILFINRQTINGYGPGMYFVQMSKNGAIIIKDTIIWWIVGDKMSQDLSVDSNDDVHITFNMWDTSNIDKGTHYMMLNGTTAVVMINGTVLSPPVQNGGQEISVDQENKVHIVWHQRHIYGYAPNYCTVGTQSIVEEVTEYGDGKEFNFKGQSIIVEWTNVPETQDVFSIVVGARGDWEYYDIKVWDGKNWVDREWGESYPDGYYKYFNLNPYLPDASGRYRIKIEHYVFAPPADDIFIDFISVLEENLIIPTVEVFYTKIDPLKDDRDGDPAIESVITLIDDRMLSKLDKIYSMWPTIAIDHDAELVHVPWFEESNWNVKYADLVYLIMDTDAVVQKPLIWVTPPHKDYAGSTRNEGSYAYPTFAYVNTDELNRAHIVWCDIRQPHDIYHAWTNIDIDEDGLPIYGEYLFETKVGDKDTDGDWLLDGDETLIYGTNPLDRDTDDDILTDGEEVIIYKTDPLDYDTDDGGVGDGLEILYYNTDVFWAPDDPVFVDLEEAVETGTDTAWISTSLWHKVYNNSAENTSKYNRTHSGSWAWWYGQESTGDYDTMGMPNEGSLTIPSFTIPYYYDYANLTFWTLWQIESYEPTIRDLMYVYISADDGANWDTLALLNPNQDYYDFTTPYSSRNGYGGIPMWQFHSFEISNYIGQEVSLSFYFNTVDGNYNNYMGWYIDDLLVVGGVRVIEEVEEVIEEEGISVVIEIPEGPKIVVDTSYYPSKPMPIIKFAGEDEKAAEEKETQLTPLDFFLILFIIALAITLVVTLQVQKSKMEGIIKSKCIIGRQTRLLELSEQMRETMEIKKTKRVTAGNLVEITDVKGNMIEVMTEIGSFMVPADFLSCAESVEDMDIDRKRKDEGKG